ncbi:MAG: VCBS domain-containing protein [Bradyrhizobium sp.]|uniref:VCBS domain-containing protein n=1 Tax=Bradyrhizobium sp. TaxID=376 RepID=UPI001D2C0465|nr:VCBS domain-containing protein [Bradyrhizobium sp.]MBV9559680.1 VCBS domain-containing protein [Bradyrhizobium sp.]
MNYAGKFDAAVSPHGPGSPSHSYVHTDSFASHAPADAIVVPDADLLFGGAFRRSGADLILSKDGRDYVVHDYFRGDKHVALASHDGAHLTGDIVNALTGEVQVSQAAGDAGAHQVIGHVTKLTGSATAVRNGVSIVLNMGDNVEKGDVVQSGGNSTLGLTFIDGTVFGLSSNARMVLNEMVYDPNGSNNSSLLSLVAGTITFVAGQTAKHGDMKVDTPVATMGIRGTAVLVEIDFSVPGQNGAPNASFQVLVEPDGSTGSYILFDKTTLQPIAVVNQAGQQINFNNGVISQTNSPLPPDVQKLIQDVFQQKFTDNSNTKSTSPFNDSTIPHSDNIIIKLADGSSATAIFQNINFAGSTQSTGSGGPGNSLVHVPGPPTVVVIDPSGNVTTKFSFSELLGKTGDAADLDTVVGKVTFADVNAGDQPTVKVDFSSFSYQDAAHNDVTSKLSTLQLADIAATAVKIAVDPAAGNKNYGSATLTYSIADSAFDFLAAGETLTLTYMVRVDTNYAPDDESTFVPITITIVGTNDAPVITTGPAKIAFFGGTSVPGGPLDSADATSGTLSFGDADLTDTHKVSTKLAGAVLSGGGRVPPGPEKIFEKALSASIATDSNGTGSGVIDWSLAPLPAYLADFIPKGQTLTLTYTVTVTDSQGAISTQTVTVTIKGTDDPAVVWIATGNSDGLWSDAANWETGTVPTANDDVIIITDQLKGLTPSFPVTIDAPAFAKSVTMNDFSEPGGSGPAPELDNLSTLTIGGTLTLSADSILHNSGTISVGGLAEFLDQSVLSNSGTLTLAGGGGFGASSHITNTGTIELSGGTLNVLVDVNNHGGTFTVDDGAVLTLNAGAIDGGTVTIDATSTTSPSTPVSENVSGPQDGGGVLALTGSSALSSGTLVNDGTVDVSGSGNALHQEIVSNKGEFEIQVGGVLLLDDDTVFDNGCGTLTIDDHATLTLDDATVSGGAIMSGGTIDIIGSSTIDCNATLSGGHVTVEDGVMLTLDNITVSCAIVTLKTEGSSIKVEDTLKLDHTTISGGGIDNQGTIEITGSSSIVNDFLTNGAGVLKVDDVQVLTLDGSTVSGGTIDDEGTIEVSSGAILTLEDDVTVTGGGTIEDDGEVKVASGAMLTLKDGVTVTGGGTLTNAGAIDIETVAGAVFDGVAVDNADGTIQVDTSTPGGVNAILTLEGGTTVAGGFLSIGISGELEVMTACGATLSEVCVANSGTIYVDSSATMTLDDTTIKGGTIDDHGTIEVKSGDTLALDGVTVDGGKIDNWGTLEIKGSTEIDGDSFENQGKIIVDSDAMLILNGTTITGGTVINDGTIESTGGGKIDEASITNNGVIESTAGTMTIDPLAQATLTNNSSGIIEAKGAGAELDIVHEDIHNSGSLEAVGGGTLKLSGLTVSNSHGDVTVDHSSELDLDGATVNSGEVDNAGELDSSGDSAINGATVDNGGGTIDVLCGTLTLDNTTISHGTIIDGGKIKVDDWKTLKLNGVTLRGGGTIDNDGTIEIIHSGSIEEVTIANFGGLLLIDSWQTLTLNGTTVNGGKVADYGVANVDQNYTLTLSGVVWSGGKIDNDGTIDITGSSSSSINNDWLDNHQLTIESGKMLTLDCTTIDGGAVIDEGTIKVDAFSSLDLNGVTLSGSGGGTIQNAGVIEITDSSSIDDAHIVNGHGATLVVDGHETLTLDDSTVTGGTILVGGTVKVDAGHALALDNVDVLGGGGNTLVNGGTIYAQNSSELNGFGSVVNNGTIEVKSGSLEIGENVTSTGNGAGMFKIAAGTTLAFDSGVASSETIDFESNTGKLVLHDSRDFKGTIKDFTGNGDPNSSDQIDLADVKFDPIKLTKSYSNHILTVSDGIHTAKLHLDGNYQLANFKFMSDGHGGTLIIDPPVDGDTGNDSGTIPAPDPKAPSDVIDAFVFDFTGKQASPGDFSQLRDGLHFMNPPPVNPPPVGGLSDQDAGIAGFAPDGQDVTGWSGLLKAALHHTDFHV